MVTHDDDKYKLVLKYSNSCQQRINAFKSTKLKKIDDLISYCRFLRNQVNADYDLADVSQLKRTFCETCAMTKIFTKHELINTIDIYEHKCIQNLQVQSIQRDYVDEVFSQCEKKLVVYQLLLDKTNLTCEQLDQVHDSLRQMQNILENSEKFHDSLFYLGQLLVYKNMHDDQYSQCAAKQMKFEEFTYSNILNIERLNENFERSQLSYMQLCQLVQTVKSIWLVLFAHERLAIGLHLYAEQTKTDMVCVKITDSNGTVMNEIKEISGSRMLSMTTSDTHILIALHNTQTSLYELKLFDLDLKTVHVMTADYEPVHMAIDTCYTYVLSTQSPFIHVYNELLEAKHEFGQDGCADQPFYMPNIIQFHVHNDAFYYRDVENTFIKVLSFSNGLPLKLIAVNLVDCLFHIDAIGRIIVVNQDNKILYLYNDDGQIVFEYDLTYVQNIDSFCISNNGHLLINDTVNKILHIA
jgi:hypothetical protein